VRTKVTSKAYQELVNEATRLMAAFRDAEDLIQIGAYSKGKNADVDRAVELMPRIREFLRQDSLQDAKLETSQLALAELLAG
jgi:flagellum-specific ATP synthase